MAEPDRKPLSTLGRGSDWVNLWRKRDGEWVGFVGRIADDGAVEYQSGAERSIHNTVTHWSPLPPALDQTNAEVSDERLREIEAWAELVSTFPKAENHPPPKDYADIASVCRELIDRRSVTSQASEGEVVAYRVRHKGDERWALTFTDPRVTPSGAINDEIEAEPLGLITEGLVTPPYSRGIEAALVKGDGASASSPVASPSKRVERLETLPRWKTQLGGVFEPGDQPFSYMEKSGDGEWVRLSDVRQALQGGRS